MPGPYPIELDFTVWQGHEIDLVSIECGAPMVWHGSEVINCHLRLNYEPAQESPEPSGAALSAGLLALVALARKRSAAKCG